MDVPKILEQKYWDISNPRNYNDNVSPNYVTREEFTSLRINFDSLSNEHNYLFTAFSNDLAYRNQLRITNMPPKINDPYNSNAIGLEFIPQQNVNMSGFNTGIGNQPSYYRSNFTSSYQYNQPNTDESLPTMSSRFPTYSDNQRPLTYADYRDMYCRDPREIQENKCELRSKSPTNRRDHHSYLANIVHNDSRLHDKIDFKLVGLILIVLIILEQVCNNKLCTIVCRSLSAIVLLTFIANNRSTKLNNNTSEKEILKNINKLTTPNECQTMMNIH